MGYLTTMWLHEAPEDEDQTPANNPEAGADEAPAEGEAPPEEDEGGEDDENFDIDTSLETKKDDKENSKLDNEEKK